MSSTVTFSFDGRDIRVIIDKRGNYWFVGRDICLAHGYKNPNVTMRDYDKSAIAKLMTIKDRMGRDSDVRVLTGAETLNLIQYMKLPLSGFESWITKDVLPQLEAQVLKSKRGK